MKQRNVLLGVIFAASFAGVANAQSNCANKGSYEAALNSERIDEVNALLLRLNELDALDVSESENVKVKKSVLDELKKQGRVDEIQAIYGSVCD